MPLHPTDTRCGRSLSGSDGYATIAGLRRIWERVGGMPGYWSAVRRWLTTASPVAVQMLTAAAVVAGAMWIAVRPGNQTLQLPASVMAGATLQGVRPSQTGDVDPRLAAAVDALLA